MGNIITHFFDRIVMKHPFRNEKAGYFLMHDKDTGEVSAVPEAAILAKLNERIDGIVYPDGFTKTTPVTRVGNVVTIAAYDFDWRLKLNPYTNAAPFEITLDATASSELKRIDTLAATANGDIVYYKGVEDELILTPPRVSSDELRITDLTIFGDEVQEHTEPIVSEVYTLAEKEKLANLDYSHFKGVYLTLSALNSAHPTASVGDYAQVNEVGATDVLNYNWDAEENIWVPNAVSSSGATNTDQLPEGSTNLYFTVARLVSNLSYARVIAALGYTPSTAPNNAQKNSDITKAEIEARLTGEITSHTHPNSGGSGDMTTTTDQSVSGIKTYLAGKLGLRNLANTFTSFFANTNTASRTYTLQNRDGTLADLTDIASVNTNKMNTPAGTQNYLSKFLTATTIGLSRLWDTGTFLGIGTVNAPTKDFTLGNQANRTIGIEESVNTIAGRDLNIEAGRTINFIPNSNFNALNQTYRLWTDMATAPNGDIYAVVDGGGLADVYKQTGGIGNFNPVNAGIGGSLRGITVGNDGSVYVCQQGGTVYKQTSGTGSFVNLLQSTGSYPNHMATAPNGDIYVVGANIYKQTGGAGNFVSLGVTALNYWGVTVGNDGSVYVSVSGGGIYKQTGGIGNFNSLSQVSREWTGLSNAPNGDIYACVTSGTFGMYKQTGGLGDFVIVSGITQRQFVGITVTSTGNVYGQQSGGDIYLQTNDVVGTANLDGGTIRFKSGTGKGAGKSRYEVWTGQKTNSGTDMQIETLREYIDENGYHVYTSMPIYADNAAAIAGGLPLGCEYRTATGVKMIVFQP